MTFIEKEKQIEPQSESLTHTFFPIQDLITSTAGSTFSRLERVCKRLGMISTPILGGYSLITSTRTGLIYSSATLRGVVLPHEDHG